MARASTKASSKDNQGQLFKTRSLAEKQWQQTITKRLKQLGWVWQHVYRLQCKDGSWRTSTTANGWPDLVAMKDGYILAIECKRHGEHPRPDQVEWLECFAEIPTGRAWSLSPTNVDWQQLANWIEWPEKAPRTYGFQPTTKGAADGNSEEEAARRSDLSLRS